MAHMGIQIGEGGASWFHPPTVSWSVHYAALASGSKGNCHAFTAEGRTLLIDAGTNLKQIRLRMEKLGLEAESVEAVAFTHEHSDHIGALPVLLRRTDWAFLLTKDTKAALEACLQIEIPANRWVPLKAGRSLVWQGWTVHPFSLPHDASDPVAYRVERGGLSAAVVTDLGHPSALVVDHCSDLDLLVLEANHDIEMLREGDYPPQLKARILSRVGHLSNAAMAELLGKVLSSRLQDVVLAHLSESNNHPDLARFAAEEVLRDAPIRLHLAHQTEPMGLLAAFH